MLKNLVDYHVHTARCGHATGRMEEYVEAAIAAGLKEIGFSDHIPMYWLPEEKRDPGTAMAMAELEAYVEDVYRLRDRYREIPVRLGLEADYIPAREEDLVRILEQYPWDYVIGSVHFLGDWNFDHGDYVERYKAWKIDDLYARFFELELAAARSGLFDFLAHLDLIKKFGHRPDSDLASLYTHVAGEIGKTGVTVELSTAGLHKPVAEVYPNPGLLRELNRHGVPLIISSDAHRPQEVGRDFEGAVALASEVGYRTTARFARRERFTEPLQTLP